MHRAKAFDTTMAFFLNYSYRRFFVNSVLDIWYRSYPGLAPVRHISNNIATWKIIVLWRRLLKMVKQMKHWRSYLVLILLGFSVRHHIYLSGILSIQLEGSSFIYKCTALSGVN